MNNQIIAGDYKDWNVIFTGNKMYFMKRLQKVLVEKSIVDKWELIDDISKSSIWSPIVGAVVGGSIFGPLGAVVGAGIGGNKLTSTYLVSVEFLSGKKALLQLDDAGYKNLIKCLF